MVEICACHLPGLCSVGVDCRITSSCLEEIWQYAKHASEHEYLKSEHEYLKAYSRTSLWTREDDSGSDYNDREELYNS